MLHGSKGKFFKEHNNNSKNITVQDRQFFKEQHQFKENIVQRTQFL
jgi:hypothetical protein